MNPTEPIALETYEDFGRAYAEAIASNAWNAGYERPSTLALLPDVTGLAVLDAGCGPGIYADLLHQRGARVTAIDVSPAMVALAKERAPTVDVRLCDLSLLPVPFADRSFDLILSSLAIHYIEDLGQLFRECHRMTKLGGYLVFSTHSPITDYMSHPGRYYATQLVEEQWNTIGRLVNVKFYRRPISALFNSFLSAGWHLDALSEGQPSDDCKKSFPDAHAALTTKPGFLFVRLRKEA